MNRWSQFRVLSVYDGQIPETAREAKVFLDNAWHHLLSQGHSLAITDAMAVIHELFLKYDSIEVQK